MNYQYDIAIDADRPEIGVSRPIEPVEGHSRRTGSDLQIERGRLDRLLLGPIQPSETRREGIGNAEFHCLSAVGGFG
jgi:hypothetical protein